LGFAANIRPIARPSKATSAVLSLFICRLHELRKTGSGQADGELRAAGG
jgi:hypothetical protein